MSDGDEKIIGLAEQMLAEAANEKVDAARLTQVINTNAAVIKKILSTRSDAEADAATPDVGKIRVPRSYMVVVETDVDSFRASVEAMLAEGWRLRGEMVSTPDGLAQAMVKYATIDEIG